MAVTRLTYCGNVHPAYDLSQWLQALDECAVPVALAARAKQRQFGLGVWWPARLAQQLAVDRATQALVRDFLKQRNLELWTLNVFPFDAFHDDRVKTAVYAPDWGTEDRVSYTQQCAEAAAALSPRGAVLPLSTLPLGYRTTSDAPPDLRRMAQNLARVAGAFAELRERTGVHCVLALEPEPCCLIETCGQAATFLEQWLFFAGAKLPVNEAVLRAHLGVCVDLCHLAVVGESPLAALADLKARGIAVPKIQLSSCLEARAPAALEQLLSFDEPRYLHQTAGQNGARALDLDEVRARRDEFAAAGIVRTHFHMPLWWDEDGDFGSTRAAVVRVLLALARQAAAGETLPLLEVETYTWPVLGEFAGAAPLWQRVQREIDFAANLLGC
ncbi:MAG: xylose isomerase [Planctomycetes bacterium]|nr:xylose isomerase [Planctomycetota bacterium]